MPIADMIELHSPAAQAPRAALAPSCDREASAT